ncbi:MAG: sigma-70 family RNA polymerase sigma factor [Patescibacteria group bacterium]
MNLNQTGLSTKAQEKNIFSLLKKKDREAFIRAYDLYIDQIYRFIYFKIGNKEEAQDLTSVVFLKTWNYIQNNTLEDFKTLKALIYRVARTSIIDYYRKNKAISSLDQGEGIDIPDNKQNIIKKVEITSDFKLIENKLRELKNEYQEVIILRFIEEMSINEIASIINKSKGNVRVLLHRGIKTLRELMEEEL